MGQLVACLNMLEQHFSSEMDEPARAGWRSDFAGRPQKRARQMQRHTGTCGKIRNNSKGLTPGPLRTGHQRNANVVNGLAPIAQHFPRDESGRSVLI
jgi:hypothetical protein